jgi:glycerate 2-kinase
MRAVVVPDAFKGTLTSAQVSKAIATGLRAGKVIVDERPCADGGEGTLATLRAPLGLTIRQVTVRDALGREVQVPLGFAGDGTAVIETAAAIGIAQLRADELDPLAASSKGAGEMIARALHAGAHRLVIALGGSATVDGGRGALLGIGDLEATFRRASVELLCDVDTCYEDAATVYGPQKGASPVDVALLGARLEEFAKTLPKDPRGHPRTGAAGGMSGALWAHGARLCNGAERVLTLVGVDQLLPRADLVITGEGCLDSQTAEGKLVSVVARWARRERVPVVAVVGRLAAAPQVIRQLGIDAVLVAGAPATLLAAGAEIARRLSTGELGPESAQAMFD